MPTLDKLREDLSLALLIAKDLGRGVVRGVAQTPAETMGLVNTATNWTPTRGDYAKRYEAASERAKAFANAIVGEDETKGPASFLGELIGPPTKTALKGVGIAGAVGGDLIKDWKWRKMKDVKEELSGLKEVPAYIQEGMGPFLEAQRARAKAGELSADDLIKAHAITMASIQRRARDLPGLGMTRPEDFMAAQLVTPAGRDFRAAGASGAVDQKAIDAMLRDFTPFGKSPSMAEDLAYGAKNLHTMQPNLNAAVTGDVPGWHDFAQNIRGIGPSKSGYTGSMVGRGDIPIADARQLILHAPDTRQEASKFYRRGGGEGGSQALDRLAERQRAMAIALDPRYKDFDQYLIHHGIWDYLGGGATPHAEIPRAFADRL
jgi:hypothetical protein